MTYKFHEHYKYYAVGLEGLSPKEYESEVGEIEEFDIVVPVYPYDEGEPVGETIVTVIAPKGYQLTNEDHANIGELIIAWSWEDEEEE
jgi:hypothetical protein